MCAKTEDTLRSHRRCDDNSAYITATARHLWGRMIGFCSPATTKVFARIFTCFLGRFFWERWHILHAGQKIDEEMVLGWRKHENPDSGCRHIRWLAGEEASCCVQQRIPLLASIVGLTLSPPFVIYRLECVSPLRASICCPFLCQCCGQPATKTQKFRPEDTFIIRPFFPVLRQEETLRNALGEVRLQPY